MSEPRGKSPLAEALAKLQADLPDIPHNQTANAGTYSYTYADLESITAALYTLMGAARAVVHRLRRRPRRRPLRAQVLHCSTSGGAGGRLLPAQGRRAASGHRVRHLLRAALHAVGDDGGGDGEGRRRERADEEARR